MRTAILKTPAAWKRGPLLADDAGTVTHLYWRNGTVADTKSLGFAMQGTVPQAEGSGKVPPGAGPSSDANYYFLGAGNDALDFAGDFSGCIVYSSSAIGTTDRVLLSNGAANVDGYYLETDNGIAGRTDINFCAAGSLVSVISPSNAVVGMNVVCFGRTGSNGVIKVNLGTYQTNALGAITPATTTPFRLGRYSSAGNPASAQTIHEVWFSTSTPSDALFTAIASSIKRAMGISAW